MAGLKVLVLREQINDELRGGRLLDVGQHGLPVLLLDLETSGERGGGWLAG